MEALRKEEIYTTDDIYALPDGERAELIAAAEAEEGGEVLPELGAGDIVQ